MIFSNHQTFESRTAHRGSGRRVGKGVCTYVAIAIYNAAMIFSPYQTSEARTAHRGSGRRIREGAPT